MRVDLHNHTYRCNHATGMPEEYILRAMDKKIDIFGFSCHAPMNYDPKFRMGYEEFKDYCIDIQRLQAKFSNQIEILLALEMDFLPNHLDLIHEDLLKAPLDYLIGSIHFLDDWGFDNPEFIGEYKKRDMLECWREYLASLKQMITTSLFQIVGHMDLLKVFNHQPPKILENQIQEVLEEIKKQNMALEINASGLRKPVKEQYPSERIIAMAFEQKVPIAFGSDAHSVEHVGFGYEQVIEIAKNIGYKEAVFFRKKQMFFYDF